MADHRTEETMGYGFAYFHWHAREWVPSGGISFSARDCRTCYETFALLQRKVP